MLKRKKNLTAMLRTVLLGMLLACLCSGAVFASDDNSLYALGITTEGVTVTPDFIYSTWEYDVMVPYGTTRLELEPVPSSDVARISDISGNEIGEDGTAEITITVTAQNGSNHIYTLHVTTDPATIVQTEAQTEPPTEPETEPETETEAETEDPRFVMMPRETLEQTDHTIQEQRGEIARYRDTVNLYIKIIYGLIAGCVVLLFLVMNMLLRNHSLKGKLKEARAEAQEAAKAAPMMNGGNRNPGNPRMGAAGSAAAAYNPQDPMYQQQQPAYYERMPLELMDSTQRKMSHLPEYEGSRPQGQQMQGQPARGPQGQQMQGQPARGPQGQQVQGQPVRGPQGQQMQGQQVQSQPVQGPQGQPAQGQPARGPQGQPVQSQQGRGPQGQPAQGQQTQGQPAQNQQSRGPQGQPAQGQPAQGQQTVKPQAQIPIPEQPVPGGDPSADASAGGKRSTAKRRKKSGSDSGDASSGQSGISVNHIDL